MSVNYIEKYNLPSINALLDTIDHDQPLAPFEANCLWNAKNLNERAGYHFFDDNTNNFFNARYDYFWPTGVFTHSIRDTFAGSPRQYRVSWVNPNGKVVDIFECATLKTARRCARFYHEQFMDSGLLETYYR